MSDHQMESQPLRPCRICSEPLPEGYHQNWHVQCEICQVCNQPMGQAAQATKIIQKCLDDGGPVAHLYCYHKATISALKNQRIPATIQDLKVLNDEILTMRHIVNPDETDYQALHDLHMAAKDLAISVGFVLDLTKDKIKIVDRNNTEEWVKEKKAVRNAERARTAETDQQRAERSALLAAERENPALRDKRKAIEGFIKGFGLSLDAATAMVEESMRKAGKDPQTGQPIQ